MDIGKKSHPKSSPLWLTNMGWEILFNLLGINPANSLVVQHISHP
jgi:hypothetical protein